MPDSKQESSPEGQDAASPLRRTNEIDCRIELAPLDSTDVALIRHWRNDYRIWQWCRQNDLISDASQRDWYERQAADPTVAMYKMVNCVLSGEHKDKIYPVGVCGFTSIDRWHRRAEFSFYVAPEYQGMGLGQMGMHCLLTHGFTNHGFHLIWGEVFEGNPAISLFTDLGFEVHGIRHEFYWKDGKFVNAILIGMTEEKWKTSRLQ